MLRGAFVVMIQGQSLGVLVMNQVYGRGCRGILQQLLECGVSVIGAFERDERVSALKFDQIAALVFDAQLIEQRERLFISFLVLVNREQQDAGVVGGGGLFFNNSLQSRDAALFVSPGSDDGSQGLIH